MPTEGQYKTIVHVDRTGLKEDGVKIIEHYVNLKKVLNLVLANKYEYRNLIAKSKQKSSS